MGSAPVAGHPFYERLNRCWRRRASTAGSKNSAGRTTRQHGRPSIPPGVYFRMLLVGYFEGLGSQRGIAWRCADSLSLREFLGVSLAERAPDHSTLTRIRDRLPLEVHAAVFQFVLRMLRRRGCCRARRGRGLDDAGGQRGDEVDRPPRHRRELERIPAAADAGRRRRGSDGRRLAALRSQAQGQAGLERGVGIEDDRDSRIAKMKDGRTHLAYKAEHVIDLESEVVLAASIYPADAPMARRCSESVSRAQENRGPFRGADAFTAAVVADKGYHKAIGLAEVQGYGVRTYIPERTRGSQAGGGRAGEGEGVHDNRRRARRRQKKAPSAAAN